MFLSNFQKFLPPPPPPPPPFQNPAYATVPALAISMEKIRTQTKFRNKKLSFLNFISEVAESNFTMTLH